MDLTFEQALITVKNGGAVARHGWSTGGTFVYLVHPNVSVAHGIEEKLFGEYGMVPRSGYLARKASDNIVEVWLPDTRDILANDWYVVFN